jgi:hypothetical protein
MRNEKKCTNLWWESNMEHRDRRGDNIKVHPRVLWTGFTWLRTGIRVGFPRNQLYGASSWKLFPVPPDDYIAYCHENLTNDEPRLSKQILCFIRNSLLALINLSLL